MNTSDKKRDIKSGAVEFPQFPGEDCLAHTASTYQEQLDARLTYLEKNVQCILCSLLSFRRCMHLTVEVGG